MKFSRGSLCKPKSSAEHDNGLEDNELPAMQAPSMLMETFQQSISKLQQA